MSYTHIIQGSLFQVTFTLTCGVNPQLVLPHPFNIDDLAKIWFEFKTNDPSNRTRPNYDYERQAPIWNISVSFRISQHELAISSPVKLKLDCKALQYSKQFHCPEISSYWINMGTVTTLNSQDYLLEVTMIASNSGEVTFRNLYDDTEVTDFSLTTAEGSVAVHKACLAAHSNVFKAMICGEWKEASKGEVKFKEVTLETLQHLKDYMYLGTLPDTGLLELLLLAKCYMMKDLMEKCIMQVTQTVTDLTLYELLQFACENNVPELAFKIVQLTSRDVIHGAHKHMKCKLKTKKPDEE